MEKYFAGLLIGNGNVREMSSKYMVSQRSHERVFSLIEKFTELHGDPWRLFAVEIE